MLNVSQESTAEATKGAGTSPIMREGVMTDNPSIKNHNSEVRRNKFSHLVYISHIIDSSKPEELILSMKDG